MEPPRLKKGLGQHHLHQPHLCRPMIEFLAPADQRVLEIGPGGGALTRELVRAEAAPLVAIELDLAWALALRRAVPQALVVVADALRFEYRRLPAATLVTGNLPYNVATAIVTRVLRAHTAVPRAALLVQREVAERLTAEPGSRDYGSLSVYVRTYSEPTALGVVPRGAFRPPPAVDGAMVGFTLRPPPLPESEIDRFFELVRTGFAYKRKTLRNALTQELGRDVADRLLSDAGFSSRVRAEEMSLEDWLGLYGAALDDPRWREAR